MEPKPGASRGWPNRANGSPGWRATGSPPGAADVAP